MAWTGPWDPTSSVRGRRISRVPQGQHFESIRSGVSLRFQSHGPGIGPRGNAGPIQAGQFSFRQQLPAGDPNVAHDVTAAAEYQLSHRIAQGLSGRTAEVDAAQIGPLSGV